MMIRLFLAVLFLFNCTGRKPQGPEEQKAQPQHFECRLYDGLPVAVGTSVVAELEKNHRRILDDLEVANLPVITVEIWANNDNFLAAMERNIGRRYPGATGYVQYEGVYVLNTGDAPHAAVHEFAHVVSLHVNNRIANNPRWLWEAVALYEAGDWIDPKRLSYMVSGNYPTLAELNTDYNSSDHKIYGIGYTLAEFVVHDWSIHSLILLIRTNGNVSTVLGLSEAQFEGKWYQFVKTKYLIINRQQIVFSSKYLWRNFFGDRWNNKILNSLPCWGWL